MPDPRCTTWRAYRALATSLMAMALGLAGCSMVDRTPEQRLAHEVQALRLAMPAHVADRARAAHLIDAVDALGADLDEFAQVYATLRARLVETNARPDATRAELDDVLTEFDTRRKALRSRVLQRHQALVAATTADEWRALAPHERRALEAVVR